MDFCGIVERQVSFWFLTANSKIPHIIVTSFEIKVFVIRKFNVNAFRVVFLKLLVITVRDVAPV
jgi:hypothetical protein